MVYLRQWAKVQTAKVEGEIGRQNVELIEQIAFRSIFAVEQMLPGNSNEMKKEWVTGQVLKFRDESGIAMTDAQVNTIIEGLVKIAKKEID